MYRFANVFPWLRADTSEQKLQSVDDQGWTRIFDWRPNRWQQHTPFSTEDSVLANPYVFACLTLISGDIGKLRPLLQQEDGDIWKKIPGKYVEVLLKPNKHQNHIQFKEQWILSKLIHGNTYALKIRDTRGRIIGLIILDPLKVHPVIADNGDVYYRLQNDVLSMVDEPIVVPAMEIIHDRFNCLYHPLVGLSPIFASGTTSTMGLKIINNSRRFFSNNSNPGGMLVAPGSISDSTALRLKEYWESNFTGDNSGKVAVLGDDLKYEGMRMNNVDAQLLEQLNWTGEAICSTFHVPAYMVGLGSQPTYNNIEAQTLGYYTQCLQSPIESMEESLGMGLGLPDNQRIQLDLDGLFRMDQNTLMTIVKNGVSSGIYAPDDGRRRFNLPPVPGGQYPYLQQQNYSLEALARRDEQGIPGETPAPTTPAPTEPVEPDVDQVENAADYLGYVLEREVARLEHERA